MVSGAGRANLWVALCYRAPVSRRRWFLAAEVLVAAVLGTWLVAVVVAGVRVRGFAVTTSDFQDYCFAVKSFADGRFDLWPSQRTVLAGALPGALMPTMGAIGALTTASVISAVGWVAALFLWARAIGGRRAGWLTVAWVPCFGSLVLLSRTVSFYPEVMLIQVATAAAVSGAIARGGAGWSLAASVCFYLLPLADLRSVTLVVALLPGAVLGGALARLPWWGRVVAACGPVLAVVLAWETGAWSYPANPASLQSAVHRYAEDAGRLAGVSWPLPRWEDSPAFIWGHGSPLTLLDALRFLGEVDGSRPVSMSEGWFRQPGGGELYAMRMPIAVATVVAVLVAARKWRRAAALVLTVTPFLVLLRSAALTLPHPRQLALGSAPLPLLFGLATGALLLGFDRLRRRAPESMSWLRRERVGPTAAVLVVVAVVAIVAGWLPSIYAPDARWRGALVADDEPRESLRVARGEMAADPRRLCAKVLIEDAERGLSIEVPWFEGVRE